MRLITACVLLLPPKCYVMPVTMRGEIGRVFVTKYNLRCKHYVRCLQILKECYSRMRSDLFHMLHAVTCYSTWYLYILNLKRFCITFDTVSVIWSVAGHCLVAFIGLGTNEIRSNCMHRVFTGWSFTEIFPHSQSNKPL